MEGSTSAGDKWTFRLFLLLLLVPILFIGIASSYYVFENSDWSQMDRTLANALKLFYIYAPLSGACLFAALVWLVVDEIRIRRLTNQLEEERKRGS